MTKITKYYQVAQVMWKTMLAYQVDTWLGAALTGFRVLLAYMLWSAVFAGRQQVGEYTLPMMITYALAASLLGSLQHQDALAWQLSNEIREGQFSKYLVFPVWVSGYFISAGLGRWVYMLIVNGIVTLGWMAIFASWLVAPLSADLWWLLVLIPLGALCMLLVNHFIALLSLKFQDVSGIMILKGSVIEFLSGSLVPLSLLPIPLTAVLRFTPFYYIVFYPANLVVGQPSEPPALAAAILAGWCLVLLVACEAWFRQARRFYEGVGI